MTMRQIMSKTPSNRRAGAQQVKILEAKLRAVNDHPLILFKMRSTLNKSGVEDKASKFNKYITTVEVMPKGFVKLSCSCDDFLFNWEVALHKKDAADIEYSNGKNPSDKNPTFIPGCCKHLYAAGEFLIEKGKL